MAEAYEWALTGTIRDGKTAIGIIRARYFQDRLGASRTVP
jgi:hypothetical protein